MADGRLGSDELYGMFANARRGDPSAKDALLSELRRSVLRLIRSRVKSAVAARAVAEDLTQEVLIRVTGALATCEAESGAQLVAWVFTIARHVVIDWRRRRSEELSRRYEGRSLDAFEPADVLAQGSESEADRALGELLFEAQGVLSARTQEVIRQRILYGATWQEAGGAAGTTTGGAKRRWQRATVRLEGEILERVRAIQDGNLRREILRRIGRTASVAEEEE